MKKVMENRAAEIAKFKYWLRIKRTPLHIFGQGQTKNNPIKIKTKRYERNPNREIIATRLARYAKCGT